MKRSTLLTALLAAVVLFSTTAGAGVAAASDVTEPAGEPADIEAGDTDQSITGLEVTNVTDGEDEVDVYVNVTTLESAGVGLDDLGVVDARVDGAELVDRNVDQGNNTTVVRMTFDVEEGETSFTVEEFMLAGLTTVDAEATSDLTYFVSHDAAPDGEDAESAPFEVVGDGATTNETDAAMNETDDDATTNETDGATMNETDGGMDEDAEDDTTNETDGTDGDGAGFGVVVAVLALLGAVFLARR